jgi:cytoskeleton protein RodZ
VVEDEQHKDENITLGRWLKDARDSRGESLDQVSTVTRIGKSYLQAIEEDQLGRLPSPAYAKGFIRLYAKHLDLSEDEAISLLTGENVRVATAPLDNREELTGVVPGSDVAQGNLGRRLAIPGFLLALVLLFALFPFDRQGNKGAPSPPTGGSSKALSSTRPYSSAGIIPAPDIALQPGSGERVRGEEGGRAAVPAGIVLRLRAVQDGKLNMTIDGTVSQEYDLKGGDLIEWKAASQFVMELDNAASVEGELNGVLLKPFGEAGKSANLTIRADGVHRK